MIIALHCLVGESIHFLTRGWMNRERQDRILGDIGQKVKTRTIPKTVYILQIIFLLILKIPSQFGVEMTGVSGAAEIR